MKARLWTCALAVAALTATPKALADSTTLIFEPAVGSFADFAPLPPGYGDHVTMNVQGGYKYDVTGGGTPNVTTGYSVGTMPTIFTWAEDFGDLHHVIFAQEPRVFEFDLVADAGFQVTLNSFDMAAWPHLDYVINSVSVLDGNDNVLFNQNNVLIEGDAVGPQHTHFDFAGVTAPTLKIEFDSRNVDSDDVGIDNINFSQSGAAAVPEIDPGMMGSAFTVLTGGVLMLRGRRRRQ
jgi:hypothetical protein